MTMSDSLTDPAAFMKQCKAAFIAVQPSTKENLISKEELCRALQLAGRNPSKIEVIRFFQEAKESVSFSKFCTIMRSVPILSENELLRAFRRMDVNNDGVISHDEFIHVMTTTGEKMTVSEIKQLYQRADLNKDKVLDYKEFCVMMENVVKECQKRTMELYEHPERQKKFTAASTERESPQSVTTPEPKPRRGSKTGTSRITPRKLQDSSEAVERQHPALASQKVKVPVPRNLKDWYHLHSKGVFYLDEGGRISNHRYLLKLPRSSSAWFTIQPYQVGNQAAGSSLMRSFNSGHASASGNIPVNPTDTALFLWRFEEEAADKALVTFSESRDQKGMYFIRADLEAGKYLLLPFTTGCRLRLRQQQPKEETRLLRKDRDNRMQLTKAFRQALSEIFNMMDLDGNGLLSREEFNLFNLKTSGEEVADDEWNVVEENVQMEGDELTLEGFLELHQMEADDSDGDTEDLWITLATMGYSKSLELDEACPFKMDVYLDDCKGDLVTEGIRPTDALMQQALSHSVKVKGSSNYIEGDHSIVLHTFSCPTRVSYVVENKSHHTMKVELDCSRSENCLCSQHSSLISQIALSGKSMKVALHLMPSKEALDWTAVCETSIIK